jgi:hypothetical protein
MKKSEILAVYAGTFIFVIVGYIVLLFVPDFIIDVVSGIVIFPKQWGIGVFAVIDYLTPPRLTWLVFALGWFFVCILVNYGSTRWVDVGEKFDIPSLFFVLLWFVSSFAVIVGYIVWSLFQGYFEVVTLDPTVPGNLVDQYFEGLFWALAPSLAALFGVRNKSRD